MKLKVLALALLICSSCAQHDELEAGISDLSVISGAPATFSDELGRSTVSIRVVRANEVDLICSGVMLASKLVLTAAHCFDKPMSDVVVTFVNGEKRSILQYKTLLARKVHHRAVNPPVDSYDVAILKLNSSAPEGSLPVALDEIGILPSKTEDLIVAGSGYHSLTDTGSDGLVRVGNQKFSSLSGRTEALIVQGTSKQSLCFGDSGGPIFVKRGVRLVLWGIYKAGNDTCTLSSATRIYPHLPWLKYTIRTFN